MVASGSTSEFKIAVVIPVFRHSVLLVEAIESILEQTSGFGIHAVIINDGCPFVETEEVGLAYQHAYPGLISYLVKPNGGLSDARNHGIRYVLENFPSVEAIYMMDADNRLRPDSLQRAFSELIAHPDADWIYPNIDMFGLKWAGDYGGDYSLLVHTAMNTCEAGSLIHRRVFENDVMFDTNLKMGLEDWDFFLCAAQKGFRGRNLEHFGFLYRKRPESMLADTERDASVVLGNLKMKHKSLMRPRRLLALEQEEAPRYAIHFYDVNEVLYCVDPVVDGNLRIAAKQFEHDCWRSIVSPGRYRVPPINVFMSSDVFDDLVSLGLIHWVLWVAESKLEKEKKITLLSFSRSKGDKFSIEEYSNVRAEGRHLAASILAISSVATLSILKDPSSMWIDSIARSHSDFFMELFDIHVPEPWSFLVRPPSSTTIFGFLEFIHRLRASSWRAAAMFEWDFRKIGVGPRNHEHMIARRVFNGAVAFPRVTKGKKHIGFVLPIVEFGGVEKVALNIARGLRAYGWIPHAFIVGSREATVTPEWRRVFESTNFLLDRDFWIWGTSNDLGKYNGTDVPPWACNGQHGIELGALHWLDAVMNFHSGAIVGIMGQLRRMGVKTLNSLHLSDVTPYGRPVGNTFLGLAFEHAFDFFVPCSYRLADWLHGMGVPREKIVVVQNAPGFELASGSGRKLQEERRKIIEDGALRVLYLGRLDAQKGIDILSNVVVGTRKQSLNVKWRIIGKRVIQTDDHQMTSAIEDLIEPPLYDAKKLEQAYAWADVVVLLSRYEGLPLTILEAMRAGAVVIATDVGANSEVVINGENGILLPLHEAEDGCLTALKWLAEDRQAVKRLSANAFASSEGHDWIAATKTLSLSLN